MKDTSLSRQAKAKLDSAIRHRINAGRVAVQGQISFFKRHFAQVSSHWKQDASRITFADLAISENIFLSLKNDFPEDDYCSEEISPQQGNLSLGDQFVWVLDPIDGTNNFALGFPLCAISLALLHKGIPIYGFVFDYSLDTLYEGGPSRGLWQDGKKFEPAEAALESQRILGMHFPLSREIQNKIQDLLITYKVRSLGSSTLMCALVAKAYLFGVIDTRCKVWDIAAAYALIGAAGLEFYFIGENPFPLTKFNASMPNCPYYSGDKEFCSSVKALLN